MSDTYTLYGSYASYYTAKVRAYLRKKNVPFVERLPSDPMFRNKVRPTSGSHRIPQLMTPDGQVLQDSVTIVDYLEERFPELPAFPETPKQRTFVHLMELLGSEGLVRLAWMHRWMFGENFRFVKMDFGRSFAPQGSDEDLQKYGDLIADRMMSYGLPESTEELRASLDETYIQLLKLFEAHLTEHPYFLGGQPTAADYAVMGAMHAHMGRDPAGLRVMQDHGPRTFRWMEHMIVPEVQSPEVYHVPVALAANDEVPDTALAILRFIADQFGPPFLLDALAFPLAIEQQGLGQGDQVSSEQDQPSLQAVTVEYSGETYEHGARVYPEWLGQRARRFFQAQEQGVQDSILRCLDHKTLADLLTAPVSKIVERVNNRFVIS